MTVSEINEFIHQLPDGDANFIADRFHSFGELYDHRIALFIALAALQKERNWRDRADIPPVWRSKKHSDGTSCDGWFILGIGDCPGKQITYHLPESVWDKTAFAETLELAPAWDGHTSADVLSRIYSILLP